MRPTVSLLPLAAAATTAFALVAMVFLSAEFAIAAEGATGDKSACTCPDPAQKPSKPWARPKFADLKTSLDESDEIAALETVQLALSEVGDGASYVWHRHHGRLSGVIKPTSSFKDHAGQVCRHVIVVLVSDGYTKKTEGVACRLANGRWQLDG